MGSLVGHVLPGLAFIFLGLWHLFNHVKLHVLNPNSYTSLPWFPTPRIRRLELLLIIAASSAYVSVELFLGHRRLHPFDPDGSIPSNHLKNFEHSFISLSFLIYAVLAMLLDMPFSQKGRSRRRSSNSTNPYEPGQRGLTQLVAAIAFGQQLLLFKLHSTDHSTLEGQYHALLQVIVLVSLAATLAGIGLPGSFLVGFVRSMSVLFQGVWLVVLAFMLWTPGLVPKGCFLSSEEGQRVVRCSGEEALRRAKALVNLEFSWFLMGMTVFGVSFYLVLDRVYGGTGENENYMSLNREVKLEEERELVVRGAFGNCNH